VYNIIGTPTERDIKSYTQLNRLSGREGEKKRAKVRELKEEKNGMKGQRGMDRGIEMQAVREGVSIGGKEGGMTLCRKEEKLCNEEKALGI